MVDVLAVIGQLLPIAIALAISTVPITVTVAILLSPTASRSALVFLIGWVLGTFAVAALFSFGLRGVQPFGSSAAQPLVGVIEMLIGLAIVVIGLRSLSRQRHRPAAPGSPRVLRIVESIRPLPAFGLAVLLNIRPKALLLAAAAGVVIGSAGLETWQVTIALGVYVILGASTVALPIILFLARPERMERPLRAAQAWIARNNRTAASVVEIVIGTVILGDGLGRL